MPFKRRLPKRKPPIVNVIVVEGKMRELRYFEAARSFAEAQSWTVVSAGGGDPKSLLAKTSEFLEDADRVFVVFDADRMPPNCSPQEERVWRRLIALAASEEPVELVASSPCFEVWLLWHFTEELPSVPSLGPEPNTALSKAFKDRLSELLPSLDRHPHDAWQQLRTRLPIARARALKARNRKVRPPVYSDVDLLLREMGLD